MTLSLLTVVVFLAAMFAVGGAYSIIADLYLRDRLRVNQRVEEEFSTSRSSRAAKSTLFKDLGKISAEATANQASTSLRKRFVDMVEQSGLPITAQRVLLYSLVSGAVLGLGVGFLFRNILAGSMVALLGAVLPVWYVNLKRKWRLHKLLSQLPDALELMARSVRAGQTMSQALQAIASEFEAPIAPEFAYCYEQQNLGLPPDLAFQDLARRTGLLEMKIFILAMMVQRQTGGNLAELLEKLAGVVRERFKIKGRIKVLTAEGRVQAWVLLALPPLVFVMM
ncbi:MAG: type II secretion system F family protein, partial [Planctomycetes bacterium]|nr:type II secretion system F family protein [Planctomycetota bacterium]